MAGRAPGRTLARAPGLRRGRLYFHVVFSLPRPIADIAYQNKVVVYDLLLKVAAQTLTQATPALAKVTRLGEMLMQTPPGGHHAALANLGVPLTGNDVGN
jgi:hypothetical protein